MIVDLDGSVRKNGDHDLFAVTFTRFVYGIGKDLKERMFATFESVRTENDRGTQSDTVRAFERHDTVVAVSLAAVFLLQNRFGRFAADCIRNRFAEWCLRHI